MTSTIWIMLWDVQIFVNEEMLSHFFWTRTEHLRWKWILPLEQKRKRYGIRHFVVHRRIKIIVSRNHMDQPAVPTSLSLWVPRGRNLSDTHVLLNCEPMPFAFVRINSHYGGGSRWRLQSQHHATCITGYWWKCFRDISTVYLQGWVTNYYR